MENVKLATLIGGWYHTTSTNIKCAFGQVINLRFAFWSSGPIALFMDEPPKNLGKNAIVKNTECLFCISLS